MSRSFGLLGLSPHRQGGEAKRFPCWGSRLAEMRSPLKDGCLATWLLSSAPASTSLRAVEPVEAEKSQQEESESRPKVARAGQATKILP